MFGVGIVGRGFGLSGHLPAWSSQERAKILGYCGASPSACEGASSVDLPYISWEEMLQREDLHIVSLAVPPTQQSALICQAAQAGKHIFCEKPVGGSLADASKAMDAVIQAGTSHAINFFFSQLPAWKATREILSEWAGGVRHAHLSWQLQSRAFQGGYQGWKITSSEGGGTLANFGSHTFHYLEWLLGPISAIAGQVTGGHPDGLQVGVDLLLKFCAGPTATVSISADSYMGSGHRLEVYGAAGSLLLANNSGDFARGFSLDLAEQGSAWRRVVEPETGDGDGRIKPLATLMTGFLDSLEARPATFPTLKDGLRVQRLLDAATVAVKESRWVDVADSTYEP